VLKICSASSSALVAPELNIATDAGAIIAVTANSALMMCGFSPEAGRFRLCLFKVVFATPGAVAFSGPTAPSLPFPKL
jgi:hypothetical protein